MADTRNINLQEIASAIEFNDTTGLVSLQFQDLGSDLEITSDQNSITIGGGNTDTGSYAYSSYNRNGTSSVVASDAISFETGTSGTINIAYQTPSLSANTDVNIGPNGSIRLFGSNGDIQIRGGNLAGGGAIVGNISLFPPVAPGTGGGPEGGNPGDLLTSAGNGVIEWSDNAGSLAKWTPTSAQTIPINGTTVLNQWGNILQGRGAWYGDTEITPDANGVFTPNLPEGQTAVIQLNAEVTLDTPSGNVDPQFLELVVSQGGFGLGLDQRQRFRTRAVAGDQLLVASLSTSFLLNAGKSFTVAVRNGANSGPAARALTSSDLDVLRIR